MGASTRSSSAAPEDKLFVCLVQAEAPPSDAASTAAGTTSRCSSVTSPGVGPVPGPGGADAVRDALALHVQQQRRHRKRSGATRLADLRLLGRFLELCGLPDVASKSAKLILRAIDMLFRCRYSSEDVCSILAHASVYFADTYGQCGANMDNAETGNVLVLNMFIAHSYVQDETCPLRVWHQELFESYCTLPVLDAAIIRILELRGYVLRVQDDELLPRFNSLYEQYAAGKGGGGGDAAAGDAGATKGGRRCEPPHTRHASRATTESR